MFGSNTVFRGLICVILSIIHHTSSVQVYIPEQSCDMISLITLVLRKMFSKQSLQKVFLAH